MKAIRLTTFIVALLTSLAIIFWPPLLYKSGQAPSHGLTSLLLLGLCVGVIYGSGILQQLSRLWQWSAAIAAWIALLAIGWLALPH